MSDTPADVLRDFIEHYGSGRYTQAEALAALREIVEDPA